MKHSLEINFNTVKINDNIKIIAKIDSAILIKKMIQDNKKLTGTENVELSIILVTDTDTEYQVETGKDSDEENERKNKNGDVSYGIFGSPYKLFILRSKINNYYKLLFNSFSPIYFKEKKVPKKRNEKYGVNDKVVEIPESFNGKILSDWNSKDFLFYMRHKFKLAYGMDRFEAGSAAGVLMSMIKNTLLLKRFSGNKEDLKKYLDWVFEIKSVEVKFPVNLKLIMNEGMITEWLMRKQKGLVANKSKQTNFKLK